MESGIYNFHGGTIKAIRSAPPSHCSLLCSPSFCLFCLLLIICFIWYWSDLVFLFHRSIGLPDTCITGTVAQFRPFTNIVQPS